MFINEAIPSCEQKLRYKKEPYTSNKILGIKRISDGIFLLDKSVYN
jgi:hypothetical protein